MRTRAGEAKIPDGPMRSDIGSWHILAKMARVTKSRMDLGNAGGTPM